MSEYNVIAEWERKGAVFTDNRYSRGHVWKFDGGVIVPASSSPHNVRIPFSIPENVDPEEAFVASISSCHLLTFLYLAAKERYRVDKYVDNAVGIMGKNATGVQFIERTILRPHVIFSGPKQIDEETYRGLHEASHHECFIANSVLTKIETQGTWEHLITMTRDHVCDMDVDERTAPATYDYEGDTYYFCSEKCKEKFAADPEMYVSRTEASQT